MAAPQPVAPPADQQQHPMPYARRKRFVEKQANIYEIMTWGSAAAPPSASPARYVSTGSSHGAEPVHGMKTRSQAAAEREHGAQEEEEETQAALALLRKKQKERAAAAATAAKVKASSIALAPAAAASILSPWATKTLQKPARRPGRKPEAGDAGAVAVVNAHRSSKALFPYPHTPGKPGSKAAEEQEAVRGVTRQLSDTAFAKKYQKPIFGGASPNNNGKEASPPLVVVDKAVQPRARQVWPKGVAATAAAPVVAVGRTPAKSAKMPAVAKGSKATSSKKSGKKAEAVSVAAAGQDETAAALTPRTLATVEAGYRSFVAALEKEREALSLRQQQRRVTRASSGSAAGAGGNVVVLASTPARKGKAAGGKGGKTPAAATVGKEKEGEFVVVEHTDALPAEVAKAQAAATAAVGAGMGVNESASSLVVDDTANSSALVGRSEEAEAALTVLKSRAARRKGKKAYDEEDEASDEEGAALKTDPRAYRAWVEQIPPAGTKVAKGLCVADCFC